MLTLILCVFIYLFIFVVEFLLKKQKYLAAFAMLLI